MKNILKILIFCLISISARCQNIDSTISVLQEQVNELKSENSNLRILLIENAQEYNLIIHSKDSTISVLQNSINSNSFIRYNQDSANIFISDLNGNYITAYKFGNHIDFTISKDTLRAKFIWDDFRRVFFNNKLEPETSIIEDSTQFTVDFNGVTIKKDKQ